MYCVGLKNISIFPPRKTKTLWMEILLMRNKKEGATKQMKKTVPNVNREPLWKESNKNCFDWTQKVFVVLFKIFQVVSQSSSYPRQRLKYKIIPAPDHKEQQNFQGVKPWYLFTGEQALDDYWQQGWEEAPPLWLILQFIATQPMCAWSFGNLTNHTF